MTKVLRRMRLAYQVLAGRTGKMTVSAVLIHSDGTKEDLGVLSEGHVKMTPDMKG